ncbi:PaaI family thioesterase [Limnobacter sp. P1]|uniref:PaaI family thioesterase n=1 Tax=Limnobacter olei TaxID=3031298 RepID=UPI0023AF227B|nr:PaaI family thioesterase [Limnobacter sp. P1]
MLDTLLTLIMRPLVNMQMDGKVPFAKACGVRLSSMGDGVARCEMAQKPELLDDTGKLADGALFTLAETCSGAAMAGGFASVILGVRPVAAQVEFEVLKPALGLINAQAKVAQAISPLKKTLRTTGKINFPVEVEVSDASGHSVARMRVTWNLKKN